MRTATVTRTTAETDIALTLDLDGSGRSVIDTGVGFLDHMLTLFASHGRFDLTLTCKGDTQVDDHHTVEDVGIALGTAFRSCLGFFTTDALSLLFTGVIVWIARRLDGIFEDQKHYLLRVHKKEEEKGGF